MNVNSDIASRETRSPVTDAQPSQLNVQSKLHSLQHNKFPSPCSLHTYQAQQQHAPYNMESNDATDHTQENRHPSYAPVNQPHTFSSLSPHPAPHVEEAMSQIGNNNSGGGDVLQADRWRLSVLLVFCLLSITNAMQWITFSPIVDEVTVFFDITATRVNYLTTIYVAAYVVLVFLSCKLYEVTGIKLGVVIAAVMNAIGASIKLIALYLYPHPALLFLAQSFNSITEILTIATPPLIANRWFPLRERVVANTIMTCALNFGCGVGVLLPTFFVTPQRQSQADFASLFWFHWGLSAAALLLTLFCFPRKPRTHASYMAQHQQKKEEARMRAFHTAVVGGHLCAETATHAENNTHSVDNLVHVNHTSGGTKNSLYPYAYTHSRHKGHTSTTAPAEAPSAVDDNASFHSARSSIADDEIVRINVFSVLIDCYHEFRHNPSFLLLIVASATELGLLWAVATVLPQMLSPYGINEATAGWVGFLNLLFGTIVCPFVMPLVDRFGQRYKRVLCTAAVILTVDMIALTLLLHFGPPVDSSDTSNQRYYVVVVFVLWGAIAGLCLNFMMPLMFEYVVELTFPLAESTSAPALTWSACLMNFVLASVFGEVLTNQPTESKSIWVFIGATIVTVVGAGAVCLTKPLHKRSDYENDRKEAAELLLRQSRAVEDNDIEVRTRIHLKA